MVDCVQTLKYIQIEEENKYIPKIKKIIKSVFLYQLRKYNNDILTLISSTEDYIYNIFNDS